MGTEKGGDGGRRGRDKEAECMCRGRWEAENQGGQTALTLLPALITDLGLGSATSDVFLGLLPKHLSVTENQRLKGDTASPGAPTLVR